MPWLRRGLTMIGLAALLAVIIAHAWVGDDAFILLRTVDQFVRGNGLVWNLGERVQAYTCPAWMLLVSACYALTHEGFYTSMALGVAVTAACLIAWLRLLAPSPALALCCGLALLLSRGFIDWSTSGLENPLLHLLVVCSVAATLRGGSLRVQALLFALLVLTRLDCALLLGPALAHACWQQLRGGQLRSHWRSVVLDLLPGASLVLTWELFALFYYGSLVPNTALAKLGHGIPRPEIWLQGVRYLRESLYYDPIALPTLLAAWGIGVRLRDVRAQSLLLGSLLYVLYVIWVGGDFMAGRFLTTPFVLVLATLSHALPTPKLTWSVSAAALFLALGSVAKTPTLSSTFKAPSKRPLAFIDGVTDERRFYAHRLSLRAVWGKAKPSHPWRRRAEQLEAKPKRGQKRAVYVFGNVGVTGYYARPGVTIVDRLALTDPLLARLPSVRSRRWRIGHFARALPDGYMESVARGDNRFADAQLGRLWEDVNLVTRGPLFDAERLMAILRLNTGLGEELVDERRYRHFHAARRKLEKFPERREPSLRASGAQGAFVELGKVYRADKVQVRVTPGDFVWVFRLNGHDVATARLKVRGDPHLSKAQRKATLLESEVTVPGEAVQRGYDELHVSTVDPRKEFKLARLKL